LIKKYADSPERIPLVQRIGTQGNRNPGSKHFASV
jgi:hypothetical protein